MSEEMRAFDDWIKTAQAQDMFKHCPIGVLVNLMNPLIEEILKTSKTNKNSVNDIKKTLSNKSKKFIKLLIDEQ